MDANQFAEIRAAYVQVGRPNVFKISKMTGRHRSVIRRALHDGYPALGLAPIHRPAPAMPIASASPGASPNDPRFAGLSDKQAAARAKEEAVIATAMHNLEGSAFATTHVLKRLLDSAPAILSRITSSGDDGLTPTAYVKLVRELSKAGRELASSLAMLQAAGRLNTGEAQTISETRHTGNVGLSVDLTPEAAADREKRFQHLLGIHARARAHVPGQYRGEEQGVVDVVAEEIPSNDVGAGTPVAMAVLLEAESIAPRGENAQEAESNARLTLAARSMPPEQIERVIDRARAKAEREGRAVGDVLEETLAAQPARVA